MRRMAVVVIDEDEQGMLQMLESEDQEPIETFGANGPHEPLRYSVGLRGAKRHANDLDSGASKHLVTPVREFLVAVADQKLNGLLALRQSPRQLPGARAFEPHVASVDDRLDAGTSSVSSPNADATEAGSPV